MIAHLLMSGCTVGGLLMATLLSTPRAVAEPVDFGDRFKCAVCHVNRLRELRKPDGPLLVTRETVEQESFGAQEAASTGRMCLSCHDGFVMDSRFVWNGSHATHPVGVPLPSSMVLAEVDGEPALPLNEEGEVYCGTCHVGHPGDGEAERAPTFLRVGAEDGQICAQCHADKTTIAGSIHARVRKTDQPPDFESRGICGRCHAPHDNNGPLLWAREPEGDGVPVNTLCRSCHGDDPSPADHPTTVLAWSQAVRERLGRKPVTEMPVFDEAARHADRGRIGCPTCHNPHRHRAEGLDEDVPGRFLRVTETGEFLCADCHGSSALFLYTFFHSEKRRGH